MLTKEIMFGMNIVSIVGFLAMMAGLNLGRTRQIRPLFAMGLMGAGTVLVFAGLYLSAHAG